MRFSDLSYAKNAYGIFAGLLQKSATTRAVIFATVHTKATLLLMELMEKTGLKSFVGRISMDRNAPEGLVEKSASASAENTLCFLDKAIELNLQNTRPILTPRFIPTCSDELLEALGKIRKERSLPVQSHLSENPEEVELVRKLMPEARFYGDAYDRFGLFGKDAPTVMAHCIYSTEEETERIRQNGVFIAHCPNSNMNLGSGIAPIRNYLEKGIRVGLGSDVAGGQTESMFRAITDAIQMSKLFWRYVDRTKKPLSFAESFYLATKGGGSFFGNVGSFEPGYSFDAIVLDDKTAPCPRELSLSSRLERAVYLSLDQTSLCAKYVEGKAVSLSSVP